MFIDVELTGIFVIVIALAGGRSGCVRHILWVGIILSSSVGIAVILIIVTHTALVIAVIHLSVSILSGSSLLRFLRGRRTAVLRMSLIVLPSVNALVVIIISCGGGFLACEMREHIAVHQFCSGIVEKGSNKESNECNDKNKNGQTDDFQK